MMIFPTHRVGKIFEKRKKPLIRCEKAAEMLLISFFGSEMFVSEGFQKFITIFD